MRPSRVPNFSPLASSKRVVLAAALLGLFLPLAASFSQPDKGTVLSAEERKEILDLTLDVYLDPDLSALSSEEKTALDHLIQVGLILEEAYLLSRHERGLQAKNQLEQTAESDGGDFTEFEALFRAFNGPIATTSDNERRPFLAVSPEQPGKNVYPKGVTAEDLEKFLSDHPESRREILAPRSVVRSASKDHIARDLEVLNENPALALLHPDLVQKLEKLQAAEPPMPYYAVPYSIAYSDQMLRAYQELYQAASVLRTVDPDFSAYLENRARDLLSDNYESGDSAWVTGSFGNLNAQIGSYETYDDQVQGVKTFFSTSLLVRDIPRSEELAKAIGGLQEIEDSLPYDTPKKVRSQIPVSIYQVVVDFGQSRGTNTATILPNNPDYARKYGRTILLRHNIMTHPDLFAGSAARFEAAVVPDQATDLTLDGNFQRTLWHEIGHYLGVDTDRAGRPISESLGQFSDLLEEMKADLVSLFAASRLGEGYHTPESLRSVYASGILRTLQSVPPRRTQPYQTMQLMQMNFFLSQGLLRVGDDHRLEIVYDRYPEVVESLLNKVLTVQRSGDREQAARFVEEWTTWNPELHGVLAQRLRSVQKYRYRRVRYAVLGE